ncbi:MAG: trimethylamine methyltransferase family protein [Nitrososphaerales archaeon]
MEEKLTKRMVTRLPEGLIKESVVKAPSKISLHDRNGKLAIVLEQSNIIFNPGSTAIKIIDMDSGEIRKPNSKRFY